MTATMNEIVWALLGFNLFASLFYLNLFAFLAWVAVIFLYHGMSKVIAIAESERGSVIETSEIYPELFKLFKWKTKRVRK